MHKRKVPIYELPRVKAPQTLHIAAYKHKRKPRVFFDGTKRVFTLAPAITLLI